MSYKRRDRLIEGSLFEGLMPFGGKLNQANRWIRLSEQIPWEELERIYRGYFSEQGRPGKDSRLMNGLMIVKHMMNMSDEGGVEYLNENPYVQYLCGYESLITTDVIEASTLTNMRKRLGNEYWKKFEHEIIDLLVKKKLIKTREQMVDATVCPVNIAYPTDSGILEAARQWIVKTMKGIATKAGIKEKVRTYCRKARGVYLGFQKKRKKTKREIRRMKKSMLQFVRRNIRQLEQVIEEAKERGTEIKDTIHHHIQIIKTIREQQQEMYEKKMTRIENRIVSVYRSKIRPIVRGKSGKEVEFGPKISVSCVNGYGFLDVFSYDAYHEGKELKTSIEKHAERFGKEAKVVIVDKIYGTRENREIIKEQGMRISVEALGRKSEKTKRQKAWMKKKQKERNRIEGLFGTLKTKYGLEPTTVECGSIYARFLSNVWDTNCCF